MIFLLLISISQRQIKDPNNANEYPGWERISFLTLYFFTATLGGSGPPLGSQEVLGQAPSKAECLGFNSEKMS
jgi:hypothetical protein